MDPQDRAKKAICEYWHETEDDEIKVESIVTVWFCYILGGWKTLMYITAYPRNYFEVTYDMGKGQMYFDHYKKVHNEVIADDSDFKIGTLRERITRRE